MLVVISVCRLSLYWHRQSRRRGVCSVPTLVNGGLCSGVRFDNGNLWGGKKTHCEGKTIVSKSRGILPLQRFIVLVCIAWTLSVRKIVRVKVVVKGVIGSKPWRGQRRVQTQVANETERCCVGSLCYNARSQPAGRGSSSNRRISEVPCWDFAASLLFHRQFLSFEINRG